MVLAAPVEPNEAFIPVSTSVIMASTAMGVSLYLKDDEASRYTLYRRSDYPLGTEDIERLKAAGIAKLYVRSHEQSQLQQYLRDTVPRMLNDESLPVHTRFCRLNELVRDVLGEAFDTGDVESIVDEANKLGRQTVELICRSDAVASKLCEVLNHDYHTFTHSANVSYYSVMLAEALGIRQPDEVADIATGGLLHDLGKLEIPNAILTKPGKLTDEEFAVIKTHPTIGMLALRHRKDLCFGQRMMVYQHHERLDGKGYPVGIVDKDIHPWGRICAVVDVFEALTSNRPYRSKMSFKQAFEIMDRLAGSSLDPEAYRCWKATIHQS